MGQEMAIVVAGTDDARKQYISNLKRQPQPPDDVNNIKDITGWADLTLDEQIEMVDHYFLIDSCRTIPLKTRSGDWAVTRYKWNGRGDNSSIVKRAKSIEQIGIRSDLRKGAFLIQDATDETWTCAHWATLVEGARLAADRDKEKTKSSMQVFLQGFQIASATSEPHHVGPECSSRTMATSSTMR